MNTIKKQLTVPFMSTNVFGEMLAIFNKTHTNIIATLVIVNTFLGAIPFVYS